MTASHCVLCRHPLTRPSPGAAGRAESFPGEREPDPAARGGLVVLPEAEAIRRDQVYRARLAAVSPSEIPSEIPSEVEVQARDREARSGWVHPDYRVRTGARTLAAAEVYGDLPRVSPEDLPHLDLTLAVRADPNGHGVIQTMGVRVLPLSNLGYPLVADGGWRGTRLLSVTDKMAAPSWSLPAGTIGSGGSCAAAAHRRNPAPSGDPTGVPLSVEEAAVAGPTGETPVPAPVPICAHCYARGGNYLFDLVRVPGILRQLWLLRALGQDPTGGTVADALVETITAFATRPGPGFRARAAAILGIADGTDVVLPGGLRRPTLSGVLAPPGAVTGFFRIHDSGDFSPGMSFPLWTAYVRAWTTIVDRLPYVRFWAPTRNWAVRRTPTTGAYHTALLDLAVRPNVTLRPSALLIGADPPAVRGFAAGTGVYPDAAGAPATARSCPVYGLGFNSCQEAGCRACWTHPDESVWYRAHR